MIFDVQIFLSKFINFFNVFVYSHQDPGRVHKGTIGRTNHVCSYFFVLQKRICFMLLMCLFAFSATNDAEFSHRFAKW